MSGWTWTYKGVRYSADWSPPVGEKSRRCERHFFYPGKECGACAVEPELSENDQNIGHDSAGNVHPLMGTWYVDRDGMKFQGFPISEISRRPDLLEITRDIVRGKE